MSLSRQEYDLRAVASYYQTGASGGGGYGQHVVLPQSCNPARCVALDHQFPVVHGRILVGLLPAEQDENGFKEFVAQCNDRPLVSPANDKPLILALEYAPGTTCGVGHLA